MSLWSINSCFQWYKNYKNGLRNARVIVENTMVLFFRARCVYKAVRTCEIKLKLKQKHCRRCSQELKQYFSFISCCESRLRQVHCVFDDVINVSYLSCYALLAADPHPTSKYYAVPYSYRLCCLYVKQYSLLLLVVCLHLKVLTGCSALINR